MAQLISNRYAEALFSLAIENNEIDILAEQVHMIYDALCHDVEFFNLLNHPQISNEEKLSIIQNIFGDKVHNSIYGLLSVVFTKGREDELKNILFDFIEKVKEHKNIVEAEVVSAIPLTEEQILNIKTNLSKKLNKQVEMKLIVDTTLIGGLYIKVAGHVIDGSIKRHIDDMKKQLINIRLA